MGIWKNEAKSSICWICHLYCSQVLKLSPSHLPTSLPAPANVERVITSGRRVGLLARRARREAVLIMVP
jgi:hypothetical protein